VGNVTTSLIVPDIGKANVVEMASHPPGRDRRAFL